MTGGWTLESYRRLRGRWELVDGRLTPLAPPTCAHVAGRLAASLYRYLDRADPDGFWGLGLAIPTGPDTARRPDFAYFPAPLARRCVDRDALRADGVPELVVEVVTPGDEERDLMVKRREYARAGARYYWLVSPAAHTVTLLALRRGRYVETATLRSGDTLAAPALPGWSLPVAALFD